MQKVGDFKCSEDGGVPPSHWSDRTAGSVKALADLVSAGLINMWSMHKV